MMLHRFAVATAVATYALLIAGSLVHGTGSSLACPDWPLCHGQFLPEMKHGVEYEHSHRLIAAAVSTMTVVLCAWLLVSKRYASLRGLAIAAPLMVLAQAGLGGITVIWKLPTAVTLSHLTLSMCFFSVTLMIAIRTGFDRGEVGEVRGDVARLRLSMAATAVLILGQILVGGLVRHLMAGLACTTFPLCFGHLWPPDSTSVVSERIHMIHRFGAMLVSVMVVTQAIRVNRRATSVPALRRLSIVACFLVVAQVILGVLSVTSLLQLHTVTAHMAVGALVLGSVVAMWTLIPAIVSAPAIQASQPPGEPALSPAPVTSRVPERTLAA